MHEKEFLIFFSTKFQGKQREFGVVFFFFFFFFSHNFVVRHGVFGGFSISDGWKQRNSIEIPFFLTDEMTKTMENGKWKAGLF